MRGLGLRVEVPPLASGHVCADQSAGVLFKTQLRYARTIRGIAPVSSLGAIITHPFPLALFAALAGGPASSPLAKRYDIDHAVNAFSQERAEKTAAGYQFWFFDKAFAEGKTVKLSVVGPHLASHPPHRHVEDEFFVVLEGIAEFYLEGRTKVVGPNTALYCASGLEHGIRNVGDAPLKYLVIKKYQEH